MQEKNRSARRKPAEVSLDWKQMRISGGTGERTRDPLVQSEGRYAALKPASQCQ